MNLFEVFKRMGNQLDVDPQVLMDYANEDQVGGYHTDATQAKWPMGSLWEVEGKVLYALTRFMRPKSVLEIGTYFGASSTHILAALKANNAGKLTSLDIEPLQGDLIPDGLKKRWKFIQAEAVQWITANQPFAELVYEDAFHTVNGTTSILTTVRDVVKPRVIVSHDAEHFNVGLNIRKAWDAVIGQYDTALITPSDCGIAWWAQNND